MAFQTARESLKFSNWSLFTMQKWVMKQKRGMTKARNTKEKTTK